MGKAVELLPGRFVIRRGTIEDYRRLAHLHYAPGHPATRAGVWVARYRPFTLKSSEWSDCSTRNRTGGAGGAARAPAVAVLVLSYPTPALRARERALGLGGPRYGSKLAFVNRHVRTISRVIVHPQFRGLGLAGRLVRRVLRDSRVRYVEAVAAMGQVHPLFERAGMRRVETRGGEHAYFLFERRKSRKRGRSRRAGGM